jgi:hypothetical protein
VRTEFPSSFSFINYFQEWEVISYSTAIFHLFLLPLSPLTSLEAFIHELAGKGD